MGLSKFHEHDILNYISALSHLIIEVHVDDLLVMGKNDSDISKFKDQMMNFFHMSDFGQLCSYLGIEVAQGGVRITLGTIDYGLVYEKGQAEAKLVSYSDSDFAGDVED
ncbi:unnamed protein product [Spirodela intermedia]|uniref:Reverse transcriptase Ty1/copia-type domain-containing protein n=1 Tax=Spirodela intermedia TaxID=51605 RepID=A0A7I8LD44_SPIIN|nr:unnamed protein product [Spirodela intermedia]